MALKKNVQKMFGPKIYCDDMGYTVKVHFCKFELCRKTAY